MEYRLLGTSGLRVSPLCLGTAFYGSITSVAAATQLVHHALAAGINFIDTANTYGDQRFDYAGVPKDRLMVEEILGRALQGRRHAVVLASKCGEPVGKGPLQRGLARRHILQQVEISLRRLGTDYLDLYYPHHPDPQTPIEESLRAFDDLLRQGKIRALGLSDYRAWQVVQALWTAERKNLAEPACVQTLYNLLDRSDERELLPVCRQFGLRLVIFSPMAGGVLSAQYRPGAAPPPGSRAQYTRASAGRPAATPVLTDANLAAAQRLAAFAADHDATASQMALAWLLSHEEVASAITGAGSPAEIDENLRAIELARQDIDWGALEKTIAGLTIG